MNEPIGKESLSFLKGKELLQICIGLYQIILKFEASLCISVEGKIIIRSGAKIISWNQKFEKADFLISDILGSKIFDVDINEDYTISINLDKDNSVIELYKTGKNDFESYNIEDPDNNIIV